MQSGQTSSTFTSHHCEPEAGANTSSALIANPNMTRRFFFKCAAVTGMLTFLGSFSTKGGIVVNAYADENDSKSFVIYVLSRDEVPIFSFDPSANNAPVPHAEVQIISLYNQKTLVTKTDDFGCALVKTAALAFECDDENASYYTFYGDLLAVKEGYRRVHIPKCFFRSAVNADENGFRSNTIQIPTQKVIGDELYLMGATLDGSDIQYELSTAYVDAENNETQELKVELVSPSGETTANVSVLATSNTNTDIKSFGTCMATLVSKNPVVLSATFSDYFLRDIPAGWTLYIGFQNSIEKIYYLRSPIVFDQAGYVVKGGYQSLCMCPGNQTDGTKDTREKIDIPAWFEALSGVSAALPLCPVEVFCNQDYEFGFNANVFRLTLAKDVNGENKIKDGKNYEFNSFVGLSGKQVWKDYKKSVVKSMDDFGDMMNDMKVNGKLISKSVFTSKTDVNLDLVFSGYGKLESKRTELPRIWSANLALALKFGLTYSFTQQLIVVFVPVFWSFDLTLYTKLNAKFFISFEDNFKNINWNFNGEGKTGTGLNMIFVLYCEAGLSAGVGVAGVASIGIRGYGYLKFTFTFTGRDTNKPYPRLTIHAMAAAEMKLQLFFFKKTITIIQTKSTDPIYDNWKATTASLSDATTAQLAQNPITSADMVGGSFVTNDELARSIEFVGTYVTVSSEAALAANSTNTPTAAAILAANSIENSDNIANDQENDTEITVVDQESDTKNAEDAAPAPSSTSSSADSAASSATSEVSAIAAAAATAAAATSESTQVIEYARVRHSQAASLAGDTEDALLTGTANQPQLIDPYENDTYNPLHGLKYRGYQLMESGVYSNSRIRVYGNDEDAFYARLATVAVPDTTNPSKTHPRTRVVVALWNGSSFDNEKVVDFCTEYDITPAMRYDVDFNIDYVVVDGRKLAAIAITSMNFPNHEDDIDFVDIDESLVESFADEQFCTLMLWDVDKGEQIWHETYQHGTVLFDEEKQAPYFMRFHNGFHPRVIFQRNPAYPSSSTILDSYIATMFYFEHALVKEYQGAKPKDQMSFMSYSLQSKDLIGHSALEASFPVSISDLLKGTFSVSTGSKTSCVTVDGRSYARAVIGWSGKDAKQKSSSKNQASSFVMEILVGKTNDSDTRASAIEYSANTLTLPGVSALALRNMAKANNELFAYTNDLEDNPQKKMRVITIEPDGLALQSVDSQEGTANTRFFSTRDGKFLYAVKVYDGNMPDAGADALAEVAEGATLISNCYSDTEGFENMSQPKSTTGGAVKRYELLETRWIDSLASYHEFYPIAQLDFNPDSIDVITASGTGKREFIFATITDFDNSLADIYRFSAPAALGIHLMDIVPVTNVALPGDKVYYDITVANTGNTFLTGFCVGIYDASNRRISYECHTDLQDCLQAGMDTIEYVCDEHGNRRFDEEGKPLTTRVADVRELAGLLWPGDIRTYRFCFVLPDGYEGTTVLSAKVDGPRSNRNDLYDGEILQYNADAASLAGVDTALLDWNWIDDLDFLDDVGADEAKCCIDPNIKEFEKPIDADDRTVSSDDISTIENHTSAHYATEIYSDDGNDDGQKQGSDTDDGESGSAVAKTGDGAAIIATAAATATVAAAAVAVATSKLNEPHEQP